jgi:predicted PurR-regulated permease PerM
MTAIVTPEAGASAGSQSPAAAEPPVSRSAEGEHGHGRLALAILATVAVVFALDWAQSLFISLLLGILFAYSLNPVVVWLERIRLPRLLGATVVMLSVLCALVLGTYSLRSEMQTILDQLPAAVSKMSASLASLHKGQASTMEMVQSAASEIERAASGATGTPSPLKPATTRVVIDAPGFRFGNFLWEGSLGATGLIAQAAMVFFLTFFLLLSGDTYKRKLVRLAGPSLSDRKLTVHILDDINESIQRYMLMVLATNVLVGLLTWMAMSWIGLENAGAWAVAAGLLHIIPYFGPAVTATRSAWRLSYSSTAYRRSCSSPGVRWPSPPSSAPSSPPG